MTPLTFVTPRLLCRRLGTAGRVLVEPLGRRCVDGRRALVTEYRVLHRLGQFDEPTMPMIRMRDANAFYLPCTGLHVRSDMVRVNRSRRCCRRLSLVLGSCTRLRNPIRGVLLAAFAMVLLESRLTTALCFLGINARYGNLLLLN